MVALHHFDDDDERMLRLEEEVKLLMPSSALLLHTRVRPTRLVRLAHYLSSEAVEEAAAEEAVEEAATDEAVEEAATDEAVKEEAAEVPLSDLRGAFVVCPCGVGSAASLEATLLDLVDTGAGAGAGASDRCFGAVEVQDLGDHNVFTAEDLGRAVKRYEQLRRRGSGGGSREPVRLVLTEKDAARWMTGDRTGGDRGAWRALAPADPLVLCSQLEIPDPAERDAFQRLIARTLQSHTAAVQHGS